jgi:hypothetical protein
MNLQAAQQCAAFFVFAPRITGSRRVRGPRHRRLTDARTVRTPEPEVVCHALSCFAETSLDVVDCLLAGRSGNGATVATVDRR